MSAVRVHAAPLAIAARAAKRAAKHKGFLQLLSGTDVEVRPDDNEFFFVVRGDILFYYSSDVEGEDDCVAALMLDPLEAILVDPAATLGSDATTFDFALVCEGWRLTLRAPSREALLHWAIALTDVCTSSMSELIRAEGEVMGVRNMTASQFSELRGTELAVELNGHEDPARAVNRLTMVVETTPQSKAKKRGSFMAGVSSAMDKMYEFEVGWRKLKLAEEARTTWQGQGLKLFNKKNRRRSAESIPEGEEHNEKEEDEDIAPVEGASVLQALLEAVDSNVGPIEVDDAELEDIIKDNPIMDIRIKALYDSMTQTTNASTRLFRSGDEYLRTSQESVTAGQTFVTDMVAFAKALDGMKDNRPMPGFLQLIAEWTTLMKELLILQAVLDEQLQSCFLRSLKVFFKMQVKEMQKSYTRYQNTRTRYASALQRFLGNSGKPEERQQQADELKTIKEGADEARREAWEALTTFRDERHAVYLEHTLYWLLVHLQHFSHGYHGMHRNESDLRTVRQKLEVYRQRMQDHHRRQADRYTELKGILQTSQLSEDELATTLASKGSDVKKEGYLNRFCTKSTGYHRWVRRWFILDGGQLFYRRQRAAEETKGHIDLLLTTVRLPTNLNRSFVFEVVCANPRRTHLVQAESEQAKLEWIRAIQSTTANLLGIQMPTDVGGPLDAAEESKAERRGSDIMRLAGMSITGRVEGNDVCADCFAPNPEWASINLLVCLCLECSGAHRAIGTHLSKVRSLAMDEWDDALVELMTSVGNVKARAVWEANFTEGPHNSVQRPTGRGNPMERQRWVRAKYEQGLFLERTEMSSEELAAALFSAVSTGDIESLYKYIALGADVNAVAHDNYDRTPMHLSAETGDVRITNLLALNGAQTDAVDAMGATPMHLAAQNNHSDVVSQLVARRANPDIRDNLGRTPADVAAVRGNDEAVVAAVGRTRAPSSRLPTTVMRALSSARMMQDGEAAEPTTPVATPGSSVGAAIGEEDATEGIRESLLSGPIAGVVELDEAGNYTDDDEEDDETAGTMDNAAASDAPAAASGGAATAALVAAVSEESK